MFGWFKRLFRKPIIGTVNNDSVQRDMESRLKVESPHGVLAQSRLCDDGETVEVWGNTLPPVRVRGQDDEFSALVIVHRAEWLKQRKKKHSHLLAELKALEVKE